MSTKKKIMPSTDEHHIGVEIEFHSHSGSITMIPVEYRSWMRVDYENLGAPGMGFEATMCAPQADYKEKLKKFVDWINQQCPIMGRDYGTHVHLDARFRDRRMMKSIADAHYRVLESKHKCRGHGYIYSRNDGRNNTIEMRSMEATTDYSRLCAYIDDLIAMITPADVKTERLAMAAVPA